MSKREELLAVIDGRSAERHYFAPLADAMFAASAAGKPWLSEASFEDQRHAAEAGGYHPLFLHYLPLHQLLHPALELEVTLVSSSPEQRVYRQEVRTPRGTLGREVVEQPCKGITALGDFVTSTEQFPLVHWICEDILAGRRDGMIRERAGAFVQALGPHGLTEIQVELPYFMFVLPGYADGPIMLHFDDPAAWADLMGHVEAALFHTIDVLLAAGIDLIWLGAPGTELLSPAMMESVIVPQARRMVEHIRARGGRSHFHCCGVSQLWVDKGYFNTIGVDLHETLSAPPVGNVMDLGAARAALSGRIVTKGNLDLNFLQEATPEQCAAAARRIVEQVSGYPHLLGATDAILYGTPLENLRAVAAVGREAAC